MTLVRRLGRLAAAVATTLTLLGSAGAAQAHAQIVTAQPSIQGLGTLASNGGACVSPPNALNTTVTTACGPMIAFGIVQIVATGSGHSTFDSWLGCQFPAGNICSFVTFGPLWQIRAVFKDSTAPSFTSGPGVTYSTATDRTVSLGWALNEGGTATCTVDGAAAGACPSGRVFTLSEGSHTISVRPTDLNGNLAAASTAVTFRILDTALVSGPADFSSVKSPAFVYSSLTGISFDCSVDNVTLPDCGLKGLDNRATKTFPNLTEGVHTFRVRARDGLNDFDRVPVVRTWTVDTVAPTASLDATSGPGEGALQATNKETFKFTGNEIGTFECRLDAADFAPCESGITVERLTAGSHRFEVRAIDRAGNIGPVAFRTWTVAAADVDDDGFNARVDCDDSNPNIRPGVVDTPDNGIDENCDGADSKTPPVVLPVVIPPAATEQIIVTIAFFSTAKKTTTKFTTLQVKNVPLGSTVLVTCKGKGCPSGLKGKGFTKKNAFGTVTLAKFIKKPLRTGDTITVVVSKPNAISAIKILKVRASKKPLITTKCQPPTAKSPVSC